MEKRYVCFVCYGFHPEMKGVSQEAFDAGENTCKEEKCTCYGKALDEIAYCEKCNTLFKIGEHEEH